jgi:hypothetical protein
VIRSWSLIALSVGAVRVDAFDQFDSSARAVPALHGSGEGTGPIVEHCSNGKKGIGGSQREEERKLLFSFAFL